MKRIIIAIFTTLFAFTLAACSAEKTIDIKVTKMQWSSWSDDHMPNPVEEIYTVKRGDIISLGGLLEAEAKVTAVSVDSVSIKTNVGMSDKMNGQSLNPHRTEFKIISGETLEMHTPTMDAGDIFHIEVVS